MRQSTKVFLAIYLPVSFFDYFSTFVGLSFFSGIETNPEWARLIENYGIINGLIFTFLFYELWAILTIVISNEILLKLSNEVSKNKVLLKVCGVPWPAISGIFGTLYRLWRLLFVGDNGWVLWQWITSFKG